MVRVNLINPKHLADQHLIGEYNEILMLLGYVRKYPNPEKIPEKYCLGKGHIKFFKNKLKYLILRHELIKKEMKKRNFETNVTINLSGFPKNLIQDWIPSKNDFKIIKERIIWKLNKKPDYYRYCGKKKNKEFLIKLIETAD